MFELLLYIFIGRMASESMNKMRGKNISESPKTNKFVPDAILLRDFFRKIYVCATLHLRISYCSCL